MVVCSCRPISLAIEAGSTKHREGRLLIREQEIMMLGEEMWEWMG